MRPTRRRTPPARALVVLALVVLVAAVPGCAGSVTAPGTGAGPAAPGAEPAAAPQVPPLSEQYGSVCDQLPTDELAGLPVTAAIGAVPALSRLAQALRGLPELTATLDAEPDLTVFAPSDAAFEDLRAVRGGAAMDELTGDPARLDGLLSYHVTGKRQDAGQLVAAGKTSQLAHGDVTVSGEPASLVLTGAGGTVARVLCGNVRTANATVFLIDQVLLPAGG